MVSNNTEGVAVLESPMYNRSAKGYGKCLRFRFLMFGAGAKTLEIHQGINANQIRVWKYTNNTVPHWRYGQMSFTSVLRSKVMNTTTTITVSSIYTSTGNDCVVITFDCVIKIFIVLSRCTTTVVSLQGLSPLFDML